MTIDDFNAGDGNFQSRVILTLFYLLIVPIFALIVKVFKDPCPCQLEVLLDHVALPEVERVRDDLCREDS